MTGPPLISHDISWDGTVETTTRNYIDGHAVDGLFEESIRNITVAPQLSQESRNRLAREWKNNLDLSINEFTQKEIIALRKNMQATVFAGNRYGSAIQTIKKSYDVTQNKAKFLARQETGLLMAKFKELRYSEIGVKEYKWRCPAQPGQANASNN